MSKEQIAEGRAMTRKWLEDFEKKNGVPHSGKFIGNN